tara:strand:+ start:1064 stop:1288 length:225 start_codon:yes stop_codon:yes gene_type:complete
MEIMYTYKEIELVTKNSSWWKQIKYRRESAVILNRYRNQGWKLMKKEGKMKNILKVDTRSYSKYLLRRKIKVNT